MDSNAVRELWARRSGEYSPRYYAYYGPNETSAAIRARLDATLDRDASILELGCSCGRHLAHLQEHGYSDLHGIEINDEAFDVMAETYPDLAGKGTFYETAIQNVVPDFEDGQFDAIFSVETLQHLHPDDEWVFAELARIVGERLLTVENEEKGSEGRGGDEGRGEADEKNAKTDVSYVNDEFPLYHRNWQNVFSEFGLAQIESGSIGRDVLRVFRAD